MIGVKYQVRRFKGDLSGTVGVKSTWGTVVATTDSR